MARRRSRKGNLTRNQKYALIAAAVLIAGFMFYGDTMTGLATGTITFTVTSSASFSLDDAAATLASGAPGATVNTSSNLMHMENNGNTDLTCTIISTEASIAAIFGGAGTGGTYKYYSYDDESSSAGTHTGTKASKASMTFDGGSPANLVSTYQFEDSTDEIYVGFEATIPTDAAVATGDTTTVTISCS